MYIASRLERPFYAMYEKVSLQKIPNNKAASFVPVPFYRDFFCKKNWQSKNYNYTVKTLMIYVLLSNLTGISLVTNITLVSDSIHYEWARERISGYHHHIFIDVFLYCLWILLKSFLTKKGFFCMKIIKSFDKHNKIFIIKVRHGSWWIIVFLRRFRLWFTRLWVSITLLKKTTS